MRRTRRLLTVGHSYAVALNRRLADEMARAEQWEVTVAAPRWFHGELRRIPFERSSAPGAHVELAHLYLSRLVHVMFYERRLKALVRSNWDLVHCWEEPYVLAGAQVAWWTRPEVPLIFSTAQNISKQYPPPFNLFERYAMNRAQGWIAFGESARQVLLGRGPYQELPRRVIPMGVDVECFRPDAAAGRRARQSLGWAADGPPVVGFLGRFVREKGVAFLMDVLDRVGEPWRALFVGAGPLEGRMRRWAAAYGDQVRILPAVAHEDVPSCLNAMDILCAPSLTGARWKEQFGRMLIEASACGIPVIASDSGEIPYVVGDAGRIEPEGDVPGWSAAVESLLQDPNARQELGRRARDRAVRLYAWPEVARRHLEFFDEVAGLTR